MAVTEHPSIAPAYLRGEEGMVIDISGSTYDAEEYYTVQFEDKIHILYGSELTQRNEIMEDFDR